MPRLHALLNLIEPVTLYNLGKDHKMPYTKSQKKKKNGIASYCFERWTLTESPCTEHIMFIRFYSALVVFALGVYNLFLQPTTVS